MDLILAAYRIDDASSAVRFFNAHRKAIGPGRRILVLNDSSLRDGLGNLTRGWEIVIGTNAFGEFSAWQEGLAELTSIGSDVMFANDTVDTHRIFTRFRWLAIERALKRVERPAVIGFTAIVSGELRIDGLPFDRWVSTYCFVITAEALSLLKHRIFDSARVLACVTGGLDEASFFTNMSSALSAHLRRWLFSGWWYMGGPLTPASRATLTRKAHAIIAEKLLSADCHAAGIEIVNPFERSPLLRILDGLTRRILDTRIARFAFRQTKHRRF